MSITSMRTRKRKASKPFARHLSLCNSKIPTTRTLFWVKLKRRNRRGK